MSKQSLPHSLAVLSKRLSVSMLVLAAPLQAALAAEPSGDVTKLGTMEVVEDKLEILPTTPVDSVFGFSKTVAETPRSITSISSELMDQVNITSINDLVALTPGSFTQSFFGVAGSLDVRGNPGENYFRGIRRIDNPGNYPQAIGASDRIDIVRGPASPIYGPSKVGGYLNFVPKSARASTGQYLDEAQGEMGITIGSWDKKVLHAEVGGPTSLIGEKAGYYFYGESENSGSYYDNTSTIQTILQASLDATLSDKLRTEFGGMYQNFKGNQVAGWNRLTQNLIDHGIYVTGSPRPLDTNGDGRISFPEASAGGIGAFVFEPSRNTPTQNAAALQNFTNPANLALVNPGTTHISGHQVLVQEDDTLEDQVLTLYFDLIFDLSENLKLTNKSFYESLNNLNENVYGFSQYAETWVFEDQLNLQFTTNFGSHVKANFQAGPSIRHQDYIHGDNFAGEYFDRRDITLPGSALDRRALATRGEELFSNHVRGKYTDSGIAFLADLTFFEKLNILGGGRYDYIDMTSTNFYDVIDAAVDPINGTTPGLHASDTKGATSWSVSGSYELPFGIRPYVTRSTQSTLVVGQGGQIAAENIAIGKAVAASTLKEYGVKATLFGGRLYTALDYYDQTRVDFNAQDTVTNGATQTKGWEYEARWVVHPLLTLAGAYTNIKVYNLAHPVGGSQFSFAGAADLPGVDPASFYGGTVASLVYIPNREFTRKAGIPENLYSLNAIFTLDSLLKGVTASVGASHVDSVWSGYSKTVKLPSYTLVNAGLHYENKNWKVGFQAKNITDERYFRSNFPDLFGSSVVLPEVPRNYLLSLAYKF